MSESDPEKLLPCQECGGYGGWTDSLLPDGTGPYEVCWCCDNKGEITPERRGLWLTVKRMEAKENREYEASKQPTN